MQRAWVGYAALLVTALAWGGTWVTARAAAGEATPLAVALVRFLAASAALLPVWLLLERRRWVAPDTRHALMLAGMALSGIVGYTVLFLNGIAHAPVGDGAVLTPGLAGVFAMLLAWAALGHRPRRVEAMGAGLAVLGVAVVGWNAIQSAPAGSTRLFGDLLLVGAAVAWGIYTVLGRRVADQIPAVTGVLLASALGAAMLVPLVLAFDGPGAVGVGWSTLAWTNALYLGLVGTALAYVTFYFGVRRVGVARSAPFYGLVPVFAVTEAAVFLGEPLTPLHVVGGLLVLAGIALPALRLRPPTEERAGATSPERAS